MVLHEQISFAIVGWRETSATLFCGLTGEGVCSKLTFLPHKR